MKITNDVITFDTGDTDLLSASFKDAFKKSGITIPLEQYLSDTLNNQLINLVTKVVQQDLNGLSNSIVGQPVSDQLSVLAGLSTSKTASLQAVVPMSLG